MLFMERISPSHVGKGGFASIMRLTFAISAMGGFLLFYSRSIGESPQDLMRKKRLMTMSPGRFYGFSENQREIDMDMREMVDRVKRKEPLYGRSSLTPYMQGVASRNSRYSGVFLHVLPWFNFVNHEQVGDQFWLGRCADSLCSMVLIQQNTINKQRGS